MRTYGWELQIGWRDHVGDFNYSAKLNLSDDQTKITKYPNAENYISKYIENMVVGNIYGLTTIGVARDDAQMADHLSKVNQDAIGSNWQGGDMMYADIDGDGKSQRAQPRMTSATLRLSATVSPDTVSALISTANGKVSTSHCSSKECLNATITLIRTVVKAQAERVPYSGARQVADVGNQYS